MTLIAYMHKNPNYITEEDFKKSDNLLSYFVLIDETVPLFHC